MMQLTIPLYQGGAATSKVSCVPAVDGTWAGHYGMAPSIAATDTTKEGWIWMGSSTPNLLWSSTKVYSGIPAGVHQFSVQCWASAMSSVLSGVAGGSTDISIASLTVVELQ
jgi:hypothetical protein